MGIAPYIHRCVIRSGSLAGNKTAITVDAFDFEYGAVCRHCDEPLVTGRQLMAHVYAELTKKGEDLV